MKVRKSSIAVKIMISVMALLLISDLVVGVALYSRAKNLLESQIKESAMNIDRCVAASVDGAMLAQVQAGDEGTDAYNAVFQQLKMFLENSGVEYVYTIRLNDAGKPVFAVDSQNIWTLTR